MYFKKIEIASTGPIKNLNITFLDSTNNPKPVVFVGQNGSGKSILISHLVNFLLVAKQENYEDVEVEKGKVYKYRSPLYIKTGDKYSYARVFSSNDLWINEWQLSKEKSELQKELDHTPGGEGWAAIPPNADSFFQTNFSTRRRDTRAAIAEQCNLYFPVNRFEDPGWLNLENLTTRVNYRELKNIQGYSNRNLISQSPLKENKTWLLDLLFDREVLEKSYRQEHIPSLAAGIPAKQVLVVDRVEGSSHQTYNAVLAVIKLILRAEGNIRLGIGSRKDRRISVMRNEQLWIPDLFQLSTGETQLINLFLSILRDYDLSEGKVKNLRDIKGIVIIDEIDAHLHIEHQRKLLPDLIYSFPNIQFIMTSHSPLFLLGMKEKFGDEGFRIIDMPTGDQIFASDFSEFIAAYNLFKETERFRRDIGDELSKNNKPIVFVEGDYDIRYILRAAELLGKQELLKKIELRDADGFGNLDKIWRGYDNPAAKLIRNDLILLYDCDTKKVNSDNGNVHKRTIPIINNNPCPIGIENLFPPETIAKIESIKPQYIDVHPQSVLRVRGQEITRPETKSVNKDEKGNLCDWLCLNGTAEDFKNFMSIFGIIEEIMGRTGNGT